MSRREFIARAITVSAALGIAPHLLAASRSVDEDSWAFLADTHIAADPARVAREINMADHFKVVAKDLLGLARRPAAVMVAGDLALNSGEAGDYRALGVLLEPLREARFPLHLLLGNHDNRERFWDAFPKSRKAKLADRQALVVKTPRANVFLLDSLEKTNSTPGLLGQEQLDWLARQLDARKSKPAIVVAHHNPMTEPNTGALKDTEALFDVLRPRKQVKAYVFGHTHRWEIAQDPSGIHLVNLPPVAYVFNKGDPSGWVLAKLNKRGMDLELRCIETTHKMHGQKVELQWRG